MAEHHQPHPTITTHFQHHSSSKLLAVIALFPIGGLFFLLSATILTGTIIGLTIATPIFFIFSPILLPGMLIIALAVTGFLTSGVFGISGVSSLTHIVNYFRRRRSGGGGGGSVQDQLDYAMRRANETAGYVGLKVRDVGQMTQETYGPEGEIYGPEGPIRV